MSDETGDPALIGRRVAGKFLIEKFLGGGAMGAVYRAKDTTLDRHVALKVMHPAVAVDPAFVQRFHREARAASRLDHPNAMRVIEFGEEPDGLLYIAMEYLEGRDLYRVIHEDWPIPEPRIADMMMKSLAAMQVAHDMGVIHRDLKPENIMVLDRKDDEGQDIVKVCDFGIAKITDGKDDEPSRSGTGAKLTTSGLVVGTPEYMSPEQARGEKLDARSDLYSMGIILYQLLTGRTPFLADTALAVVLKHITEAPEPPSKHYPNVHKGLEEVCVRALSKAREDRFQSARDMRAAIRAAIEGRPIPVDIHAATQAELSPSRSSMQSAPSLSRSGAPALSQPVAPAQSSITPLGTAVTQASGPSTRWPVFALVGALALALGAGAFVFVIRPGLRPQASDVKTVTPVTTEAAKTAEPTKPEPTHVVAPPTSTRTTPDPAKPVWPVAKNVAKPSTGPHASAAPPEPSAEPEPEPAPVPAPASAPTPAPAPAPEPAPAPAPVAPAWSAASCKATLGQKKSVSGYAARDLNLVTAEATWTSCARTALKEKPGGPIAASVHLAFNDTRVFHGATCTGCAPALAQCIATSTTGHTVSVTFRSGDATGDPAFEVPVTFTCD